MDLFIQKPGRRAFLKCLGVASALSLVPTRSLAAPVGALKPVGNGTVDHSALDQILGQFVVRDDRKFNRVNYRAFKAGGLGELKAYIASLQSVDPAQLSKSEAHAFWINLYNAKTLEVVLDHYPVRSIKDINLGGSLVKSGPWSKKLVSINGIELSLDDIEQAVVRPFFKDPLSHYGLNCASRSCPNLAQNAYTGAGLADALQQGAREYINHERGLTIVVGRITASKIYSWYAADFGGKRRLKAHWKRFATLELAALIEDAELADYSYDWSLNDA